MIRTTIGKSWIKRPIRVTYGWTQVTPYSGFLDPAWDRSVPICPGMVAMKTRGTNFTLMGAQTGAVPLGLFADYVGGDGVDRLLDQGINATAVWILGGPDAEVEILAPAFDTSQSWVDPANGTVALVYAQTAGANRGKLVPAGTSGASTKPIARLVAVNSATKITIGGLSPVDYPTS